MLARCSLERWELFNQLPRQRERLVSRVPGELTGSHTRAVGPRANLRLAGQDLLLPPWVLSLTHHQQNMSLPQSWPQFPLWEGLGVAEQGLLLLLPAPKC